MLFIRPLNNILYEDLNKVLEKTLEFKISDNANFIRNYYYMIREAVYEDLNGLLELYLYLHETEVPSKDEHLSTVWNKILTNEDYHLIVAEENNQIVASCTLLIVPNLTRGVLPYALVENVVTHKDYRGKGLASACLEYAKDIAIKNGCYKMMLITGSNNPKTHDFYKNNGYSKEGKTAYYQLLKDVNWNKQL